MKGGIFVRRIKIISFVAAVLIAVLSSCHSITDADNIPPLYESPTTPSMEDVSVTELPITVHEGATENFLLPLEEYSWEREHAVEFVMIHFTSNVVNDRE